MFAIAPSVPGRGNAHGRHTCRPYGRNLRVAQTVTMHRPVTSQTDGEREIKMTGGAERSRSISDVPARCRGRMYAARQRSGQHPRPGLLRVCGCPVGRAFTPAGDVRHGPQRAGPRERPRAAYMPPLQPKFTRIPNRERVVSARPRRWPCAVAHSRPARRSAAGIFCGSCKKNCTPVTQRPAGRRYKGERTQKRVPHAERM